MARWGWFDTWTPPLCSSQHLAKLAGANQSWQSARKKRTLSVQIYLIYQTKGGAVYLSFSEWPIVHINLMVLKQSCVSHKAKAQKTMGCMHISAHACAGNVWPGTIVFLAKGGLEERERQGVFFSTTFLSTRVCFMRFVLCKTYWTKLLYSLYLAM